MDANSLVVRATIDGVRVILPGDIRTEQQVALAGEADLAAPILVAPHHGSKNLDPGFVDALHGLAMAHAEKGELDAAIAAAKRITEASPDDPLGYTSLSMLYQRAGQIAEAETAANQARVLEWKQQLTKP